VKHDFFKNRRTIARIKHIKNLRKTVTGYIKLKLSELSVVRLQPWMDEKWKR